MLVPSGIGLIVFGVILLIFRESVWDYQRFLNRSRGMKAERTEEYDRSAIYGPVAMILVGIGAIVIGAAG